MSGGKGGSNTVNEYHGTIAGALGEGPAYSLEWIILGARTVYSGQLLKPEGEDYSEIDLIGVGRARFYWGTETQVADPTLTQYDDHPGYRGWVYIVLIDCTFGSSGETNAPTIEVGWRRLPNQLIVTGGPAANDGACTANPIAVGSELLTSPSWGGLPSSKINAASFQDVADDLQAEPVENTNRVFSSIAPLWNEQVELRAALADISSVSRVWLRVGVDGRIEAGRRKRDPNTSGITHLTAHDIDTERFRTEKSDSLPNSFAVEFRDATKHHKSNVVTVDNTALIRSTGITRRQTAKRPLLIWRDQAVTHGADLLRDSSAPKTTLTLEVRRSKAVNPDGTAIRPGDYFTYNVEIPGEAADTRLFRCIRREFNPTGPITLIAEMELSGAVQAIPFDPEIPEVAKVTPPIALSRIIPVMNEATPAVAVLAARPEDMAYVLSVEYSPTSDGDFGSIGTQSAFALPLELAAAAADDATTLRVTLRNGANGENFRRDAAMLLNWNGGTVEAGADRILICLVKKDGSGNVVAQSNGQPWIEFVSVAGPASAVSTDTYDVPVLRARLGTAALDFNAGTFPDAWSNYEAWCVSGFNFETHTHSDFLESASAGATAFFRLIPAGLFGSYSPEAAWAERGRRSDESIDLAEFYSQPDDTSYVPEIEFEFPPINGPTNLTLTSGNSTVLILTDGTPIARLLATWIAPASPFVRENGLIRVQYKKSSDSHWLDWARMPGDQTECMILDVIAGEEHDVRVQSQLGQSLSAWETGTNHEVLGDTDAPAAITGVTATAYPGYIRVSWPAGTDGVDEYKVYRGTSTSFGSASLIGETPGLMWDDPLVNAGTTYRYWIVPVDRSNNPGTQSNRADETAIEAPIQDVTPSSPTAMTKTGEGVRVAGDGRVTSYFLFTLPAKPSNSIRQEILYRIHGTAEWTSNGQYTNTSQVTSVPIDDLVPGQSYDVATRAWSASKVSSVVNATSAPYTAPNKSAPAAPTGVTLSTTATDMARVPVAYAGGAGGAKYAGALLKWTPSADPHAYQEIQADVGGTIYRVAAGVSEFPVYSPLTFNPTAGETMRVRAIAPGTNTPSAWATHGLAFTSFNYGTGNLAEQNSTNAAMSAVKIGNPSAASVQQQKATYGGTTVVALTGGAPSENFTLGLSGKGFNFAPGDGAIEWQDGVGPYFFRYNWPTSTASVANITAYSFTGANITAGNVRISYRFWET